MSLFVIAGNKRSIREFLDAIDDYMDGYPNDIETFDTIFNAQQFQVANYAPIGSDIHKEATLLIGDGNIDVWSDKLLEFMEDCNLYGRVLLDNQFPLFIGRGNFDADLNQFVIDSFSAVREMKDEKIDVFPDWFDNRYAMPAHDDIRLGLSDLSTFDIMAVCDPHDNAVKLLLDDDRHAVKYDVSEFMSLSNTAYYYVDERADIGDGCWPETPVIIFDDDICHVGYNQFNNEYYVSNDNLSNDDASFDSFVIGNGTDGTAYLVVTDESEPIIDTMVEQGQVVVTGSFRDANDDINYIATMNPYITHEPSFETYTEAEFKAHFGEQPDVVFTCQGDEVTPGNIRSLDITSEALNTEVDSLVRGFMEFNYDMIKYNKPMTSYELDDMFEQTEAEDFVNTAEMWDSFESFVMPTTINKPLDVLRAESLNVDKDYLTVKDELITDTPIDSDDSSAQAYDDLDY